jgi:hypothetical protein
MLGVDRVVKDGFNLDDEGADDMIDTVDTPRRFEGEVDDFDPG